MKFDFFRKIDSNSHIKILIKFCQCRVRFNTFILVNCFTSGVLGTADASQKVQTFPIFFLETNSSPNNWLYFVHLSFNRHFLRLKIYLKIAKQFN